MYHNGSLGQFRSFKPTAEVDSLLLNPLVRQTIYYNLIILFLLQLTMGAVCHGPRTLFGLTAPWKQIGNGWPIQYMAIIGNLGVNCLSFLFTKL